MTSIIFILSWSLCFIDGTATVNTIPSQSGPGSIGNEKALHTDL